MLKVSFLTYFQNREVYALATKTDATSSDINICPDITFKLPSDTICISNALTMSMTPFMKEPFNVFYLDSEIFHKIRFKVDDVDRQTVGWQLGSVEAALELLLLEDGDVVVTQTTQKRGT